MTDAPLLDVENLWVKFRTRTGVFDAVRGISFTLGKERLGIVGESGSGKSMTALSLMRLLPRSARLDSAHMRFQGEDLTAISDRDFAAGSLVT